MNERIRELAISSGIYDSLCDPYDSQNTGDAHGSIMNDLEKFAELIVRECIKTYNDDGYQTEHEQDQRVLKHFGVEL
jgi:hypothetical protein